MSVQEDLTCLINAHEELKKLKDDYDDLHDRLLRAEERVFDLERHLVEISLAIPDLEARLTRWKTSSQMEF